MVSKTQKIIFLYPPKTASNSLRVSLNDNGFIEDSQNNTYLTPKLHLKLDEIMVAYDIESLDGYKVIQVTRNPYDRMISSYYHQIRIFNRPDFDIAKYEKAILEDYSYLNLVFKNSFILIKIDYSLFNM